VNDEFLVAVENGWDACIDCGHCVATCPTGAMYQRSMGPDDCEELDIHLIPRWDMVRQFLMARRSVRTYIQRPVEKEKLELLLDVSRFAPNGANRQVIQWVVVNDQQKVKRLAEMTIEWMKAVKEKNLALYLEAGLGLYIEEWNKGNDRICRGAPTIIMACAPKDERTAPPAAMIGIHQIQLAAIGIGLGTTFSGSINTASQGYPPIVEMLELPEGYIPHATCVLGYSAERYLRIPARKPVNVKWI
jgi:nitroreductase